MALTSSLLSSPLPAVYSSLKVEPFINLFITPSREADFQDEDLILVPLLSFMVWTLSC